MKLTELNIVGFKSFAKKTNLVFHDGITAIVGPNGCGKSNIVDAIRWVMGEQRSSALRSEKMDNVIFNGSAAAKAVGMAEVSIKLENTRNLLPVDYSEVLITRRLFRSGESQYLINGNPVRLKDILDLFMDTGITGNSYSVIELPQIEKILNGEPEERRRIFEEAAGITKFKQRRKLTFKKLEATEKDLVRVEDILSEVEKNVRSLKRQVAKAERYQEIAGELRRLEIQTATHEYSRLLSELEPLETTLALSIDDREKAAAELASHDAGYEALRAQLLNQEKALTEEQNRLNQLTRESQKLEERVLVNSERIRTLNEMQERYQKERVGLVERLGELEQTHDETAFAAREAKRQLETAQAELEKVNAEYQSLRALYDAKRAEIKQTETELLMLTETLSKKQNEGERLRATEEGLSRRLEQLSAELAQADDRLEVVSRELQVARAKETELAGKLAHARERLAESSQRAEEAHTALDRLNKLDLQDRNRIEVLENNAEMIRKIMESYQDYPSGVRFLATVQSDHFIPEGAVANVITVSQEHRTAISSALGEAAAYLIVKDTATAYAGIGLLQQDRKGFVSFLPLDQLNADLPAHPDVEDLGVVGWANELVRCESKYRPVVDVLLGDFLVVQDLETADRLFDRLKKQHINIVTLSGEVRGHWGVIRGGSHSKRQSDIVGRQEELQQLAQEIEGLQSACERRKAQIAAKAEEERHGREQAAIWAHEVKELETYLSAVRLEVGRLAFEESRLRETQSRAQQEKDDLMARAAELSRSLQLQDSDSRSLQERRAAVSQKLQGMEEEFRSLEAEVNRVGERMQKIQISVAKLQSEYDAELRRSDSVRQQLNETRRMIEQRDEESLRAAQEVEELAAVNEEYRGHIEELSRQIEASRARLEELREQQYQTNVRADEMEKVIRELRRQSQSLADSVHQLELRISELRMRAENLVSRIREEYEHDLRREPIDSEFDVEAARSAAADLKERLKSMGPVNLLALKEYEQEKERYDFLNAQREDLLKARENLTETIELINKTARERFLATFEQVQKNFNRVFETFFEGGRATLVLREGDDPLEAEIDIYAAPGGKKPASLQLLSGGEKSLTAVSLLLAIYLVKPSPFCIFDEVDAPLDDKNVERFAAALREFSKNTQFIVVTHNKLTMRVADQLYGVTMEEEGVSQVVSVKFETAEKYAA
ncbi:MAG: chromosome segregation protein SMC [candidate division KSB1 bacterium]|nr:chromosome segregation protein SMC [candidate division KSB1 bacterium]